MIDYTKASMYTLVYIHMHKTLSIFKFNPLTIKLENRYLRWLQKNISQGILNDINESYVSYYFSTCNALQSVNIFHYNNINRLNCLNKII